MTEAPLCSVCMRHIKGEQARSNVDESWKCALCFGIFDSQFVDRVATEVKKKLDDDPYDSKSFVLALNVPVTTTLRDAVLGLFHCTHDDAVANDTPSSLPFKLRLIHSYIPKIQAEQIQDERRHAVGSRCFVTQESDSVNVDGSITGNILKSRCFSKIG
ncbi:hypothetical protein Tcan_16646 [Toxocara canis]|uniref:Uncharacterized protein n=1 Tax=Toxocara canis TaxID=6265 RepID=A0A0B2VRP6_TOXCA|nr:hypothetical protein Tcan_16646 [Toxocara canis]